jgi:hypothetical protein
MFGVMKVLGGVLVFGGITATHVSAFSAHAQVDPGVAGFDAVFADVGISAGEFHLCEVRALSGHKTS